LIQVTQQYAEKLSGENAL